MTDGVGIDTPAQLNNVGTGSFFIYALTNGNTSTPNTSAHWTADAEL